MIHTSFLHAFSKCMVQDIKVDNSNKHLHFPGALFMFQYEVRMHDQSVLLKLSYSDWYAEHLSNLSNYTLKK